MASGKGSKGKSKRVYVSQTDVPRESLKQALRIPIGIFEQYGGQPTRPLAVATALKVQPTSSGFRMLCGAAIAYGLTQGGYNSQHIELTPLSRRILAPTIEGDDWAARREALLKPRVVGEFLAKYDGSKLPREDIGQNVLVEMGVPRESSQRALELILDGADSVGMIKRIGSSAYVDLGSTAIPAEIPPEESQDPGEEPDRSLTKVPVKDEYRPNAGHGKKQPILQEPTRRVFLSHGRNRKLLPQLKDLLSFGELEAVIAVETDTVSKPVPDKVLDAMRSCSAAIIHLEGERELSNEDGGKEQIINSNVLIEIGAAMALFGKRFILLVQDGLQVPSNLQGLFQVRYVGDSLDGDATIRLLRAINDMKKQAVPVQG